jgi:hypothetical protein
MKLREKKTKLKLEKKNKELNWKRKKKISFTLP